MILSGILTLHGRRFRRRLRIRSVLPIVLGNFIGSCYFFLRGSYDFIGREYMSCTLNVTIYYLLMYVT